MNFSQQHEHEKNQNAALVHENSELRGKLKSYDTKLHQMEDQIKDASNRTTSDKAEIDKLTGTNRLLLQQIKYVLFILQLAFTNLPPCEHFNKSNYNWHMHLIILLKSAT